MRFIQSPCEISIAYFAYFVNPQSRIRELQMLFKASRKKYRYKIDKTMEKFKRICYNKITWYIIRKGQDDYEGSKRKGTAVVQAHRTYPH